LKPAWLRKEGKKKRDHPLVCNLAYRPQKKLKNRKADENGETERCTKAKKAGQCQCPLLNKK
jgi:hypothetical protein